MTEDVTDVPRSRAPCRRTESEKLSGSPLTSPSAGTATARITASHPGGVLGLLVTIGPERLVVSILLVAASLALRRRIAAAPAHLAGALLCWGMYAQASVDLMYATIAVGYLVWISTYAWTRVHRHEGSLAEWPTRCSGPPRLTMRGSQHAKLGTTTL